MLSFEDFILEQMKEAGLSKKVRKPIYDIGYKYFKQAFTHSSFRSINFQDIHEFRALQFPYEDLQIENLSEIDKLPNYEQLEFLGDKQINTCISHHIIKRYPNLPVGNLTFSFQKLASEKYLSKFGENRNFFEYILISPTIYKQAILWREGKQNEIDIAFYGGNKIYNIYSKLIEDCVESFANALVRSVDEYSKTEFGPGMAILLNWTRGIMDEIDFDPLNIEQIKAPGMILRELWTDIYYDEQKGKKFGNHDFFFIDQSKRTTGHVPIVALDPLTRQKIPGTSTIGFSEADAKLQAAILAIEWLKQNRMKDIEKGRNEKYKNKTIN